jgi:NAD(P)-dependent dehydrogenase (short-subunit alcohol dehydrogenase family)
MKLRNKKVLVTGGGRRIGAAICRHLAQYGANIVVHCNSSGEEAASLCSELVGKGVQACSLRADLMNAGSCRKLIEQAHTALNGLDVLVNNAAVFMPDTLATFKRETAWEQFQVNLFAPLMLTQAFADVCESGRVINLLDQRIDHIDPANLTYTLSKKALRDATATLALQLAPRITVNAVAPGAVLSPERTAGTRSGERAGSIPLGRAPSPIQIAEAVVYLVCADSISGQVIYVDGAQHLQPQEYERI